MRYTFLQHEEGIKFKAYGETIEEVFLNSALAMVYVMCEEKVSSTKQIKIKVKGKDMESLLYNFLEEFLSLLDSQNFIVSKIRDIRIDNKEFKLVAKLSGDNSKKYKIKQHVNAVAYNDLIIGKENKKMFAQVVLDV